MPYKLRIMSISMALFLVATALPAWCADPPFNRVNREFWHWGEGDRRKSVSVDVTLEATGLWGPLPADDPSRVKLDKVKKYKLDRGYIDPDDGPLVYIAAYQTPGQPVSIKVTCPTVEQVGFVRNSDKSPYLWFQPTKRRIGLHIVQREGPSVDAEFAKAVNLKVDEQAGTMSWTPTVLTDKKGRPRKAAPEVIEITLFYRVKAGTGDDKNASVVSVREGGITRRVAWLVLPMCGVDRSGPYIPCPRDAAPAPGWRSRTLGELSVAVPEHWQERLAPSKDQAVWQLGDENPPAAGLMLVREKNPKEAIDNTLVEKEGAITLGGKPGHYYFGKIKGQKGATGKLVVLNHTDSKGQTLVLGAASTDWPKYAPVLEAILASLTFGSEAPLPKVPTGPPGPDIPRLVTPPPPGAAPGPGAQAPATIASRTSGGAPAQSPAATSASPAAPATKAPVAPSTTPAAAKDQTGQGKLGPEEQAALAKKLFQQMIDTPEDKLEVFDRLYKEVMERCPDTPQAEISYWRLSNLYLMAYEPPKMEEIITLLERFLARYPKSEGVPHAKQRLQMAYERTGRWCKAADMYDDAMPQPPAQPAGDGRNVAIYLLHAEALNKCGRLDQAKAWYQVVQKAGGAENGLEVQVAKDALAQLAKGASQSPAADGGATQAPAAPATSAPPATSDSAQLPSPGGGPAQAPAPPTAPAAPATPDSAQSPAPGGGPVSAEVTLVRKRGFADLAGRHGDLRGDGSPDSRFKLVLTAPGRTLTGLAITSTGGQPAAWNTTPGDPVWLLVVASKGKPLNRADGSVALELGQGPQKYDLLVQDNNSIAGGKTAYELTATFADGDRRTFPVADPK